MKVAIVGSNRLRISQNISTGPEIFIYTYVKNLILKTKNIKLTVFASGNSDIPTRIISVNNLSSLEDQHIGEEFHKLYEFALLSRAFSLQNEFDLYHINIGNGEVALPFTKFIKKPVLITLHSRLSTTRVKKYLRLFKHEKNVFFVAISDHQRSLCRDLNYIKTIYHGIDLKEFKLGQGKSEEIFWIGRGVPEKGLDIAFAVVKLCKRPAYFFISPQIKYEIWLNNILEISYNLAKIHYIPQRVDVVNQYQKSKLLLFPIQWEEPFGLVMIEAMACGTPVVAFARGSVPEILKDGETGFIVNSSDEDKRGDWIIKKTGIEGLCEAVERIYTMPQHQYQEMRIACRRHVEANFTVERMIDEYVKAYEEVITRYKSNNK